MILVPRRARWEFRFGLLSDPSYKRAIERSLKVAIGLLVNVKRPSTSRPKQHPVDLRRVAQRMQARLQLLLL